MVNPTLPQFARRRGNRVRISGAMARKPQGSTATKPVRKRTTKTQLAPPSAAALGIDDLMGEFASTTTAPARGADLDDLLAELSAPEPAPAQSPAPLGVAVTELDDILAELPAAPPSTPAPAATVDLDDLLGEILDSPPAPEPAAAVVDPLDDILGELAPVAPAAVDPLDDILGELAPVAQPEVDPLDDILGELTAVPEPAPTPVAAIDPLDDILGELPAAPAQSDPLDDMLGEIPPPPPAPAAKVAAPPPPAPEPLDEIYEAPPEVVDAPVATAASEAEPEPPAPRKERKKRSLPKFALPKLALPGGVPAVAGLAVLLLGSNALSYWMGTLVHTVEASPAAVESAAPEPEGIMRYVGEGLDFRIEDKTVFESEEFKGAVDELVGGPEVSARIDSMLDRVRATEPITRVGARILVRACNPESCGQENFVAEYDTANKRVSICITQPYVNPETGMPTAASSWIYDEEGSREIPACEGFPHPPPPPRGLAGQAMGGEGAAEEMPPPEGGVSAVGGLKEGASAEEIVARIHARLNRSGESAPAEAKPAAAHGGEGRVAAAKATAARAAAAAHDAEAAHAGH